MTTLTLAATFILSLGTVSAECQAFSQRIVSAPPSAITRPPLLPTWTWLCAHNLPCTYSRCTPPMACTATTRPESVPCEIRAGNTEMWTIQPAIGQVVMFSVRGVDPNGARSPWTGGP